LISSIVEAWSMSDRAALLVEVEADGGGDLAVVAARSRLELDIQRIGLGAMVQLQMGFSWKSRSGRLCARSHRPPA
jgi:hypothetical protein